MIIDHINLLHSMIVNYSFENLLPPFVEPRPKANSRGELSVYYYADSNKGSAEDVGCS